MERASLSYIFFTFLKLGATAFGGYMSLVAIVQKQLVEVDKKLKEEDLLDGIFLTSVLPGPVAVNTIAYVGNHLRGIPGAVCRNHYSLVLTGYISFVVVFLLRKYTCGKECVQRNHSGYYCFDRYGGYRDDT